MESSDLRHAVVAGQFYPVLAQEIRKQIDGFIDTKETKADAFACILPHAGYIYSGRVAVQTVSRINIKDKVILLGPNHTGRGQPFSIMTCGAWQTPLGSIKIDSELAAGILGASEYLKHDILAHRQEHSLEVELPILQYFKESFEIVPIALISDDLTV
jgi:MEMO1 family protein